MYLYPKGNQIKTKRSTDKDSSDEWTNQEDTQQVYGLHFYHQKKEHLFSPIFHEQIYIFS